jgi:hypothetical protein
MTATTRKDLIMRSLLTSTVVALVLTAGAMTSFAEDSSAVRQSNGVETANGAPVFEEAQRNSGGN